jgi:hypothetical protein
MSGCSLKKSTFQGWDSIEMKNEFIRLVAVPEIGGRIMACDLGEISFIYNDPDLSGKLFSPEENQGDGSLAAWKNYGGDKTWPSPQGWDNDDQWHGPPDPVLDTGNYTAAFGGDAYSAWIEMTSPQDPHTGVQITRKFTIQSGSSRVMVHLSFKNISQRTIKWSIWDVIQLDASRRNSDGSLSHDPSCSVTARLNPASRFTQGYYVMFGDENNPQWRADSSRGLVEANYLWEIGKIGIDSDGGWAAFTNLSQGCAFTELFTHFPGEQYPDQGVGIECWTVGRGKVANLDYEKTSIYLMEVEVLSPFYTFLPGESKSFELTWGVCKVGSQVLDAKPGGCTTTRFSARKMGNNLTLTGAFGVFDAGELELHWLDSNGKIVSAAHLQPVSPNKAVEISSEFDAIPGAMSLQLLVKTSADNLHLLLAESNIQD